MVMVHGNERKRQVNVERWQTKTATTGDRFTYDVRPKTETIDRLAPDGTEQERKRRR